MKTDVESAERKKRKKKNLGKKSCSTSQFSTNHKKIVENSTSEKNGRRKIKKTEEKLFKCYFLQLNLLQQVLYLVLFQSFIGHIKCWMNSNNIYYTVHPTSYTLIDPIFIYYQWFLGLIFSVFFFAASHKMLGYWQKGSNWPLLNDEKFFFK